MPRAAILIVDDEPNMLRTIASILKSEGFDPLTAESGEAALAKLASQPVQLVVTDARMDGLDGFAVLEAIRKRHPQVPVVMMTAYATPKLAVRAIKGGAVDYIAKPFQPEEFLHVVRSVVRGELLQQENRQLRGLLGQRYRLDDLLGECPALRDIRELIRQTAPTDATVLILGESGTGKEMAASALHEHSRRQAGPFVSLNCAAIPENLLESELFGHERGAFTGAVRQRVGRFEEANGGTLFLDEIGDMSPQLQSKLLRVLETRRFQRLGGSGDIAIDVRLVSATNQNVRAALGSGQLREDLYHRLNVVQVNFPPLRERGDDVLLLAEYFLKLFTETLRKQITGFADATRDRLRAYHWPGNIRELRNAIERAVIVESTRQITPRSLPTAVGEPAEAPRDAAAPTNLEAAVAQFERHLIESAIRRHHGRINETANDLGISRHALRYRMQKLGMSVDNTLD